MVKKEAERSTTYIFNNPTIEVEYDEVCEQVDRKDVQQAMWRYAIRISKKKSATPAELEAMTRAAGF